MKQMSRFGAGYNFLVFFFFFVSLHIAVFAMYQLTS